MEIGILDADIKHCNDLCSLVKGLNSPAIPIYTLENLSKYLKKNIRKAIILNIDTPGLGNKDIKNLS
ncbi:MAG: hypothetical protein GXP56_15310, partial [Deltaproteobacteria bacterium]|nr:hypothetical protein [Deltaproteobacteria bacterium]